MALPPGTRLGPYEIVSALGAGGMGEVYRATDTKLKRQVAIKILPASLAADRDRLARFQREAEVLASLNHPNIAGIYGIEETHGSQALIMELVEGEDLSELIARGPVSLSDALPIARQIAEALEAAHEQGIIHRDLKPANVKVRADGTVKVLDFGLAKALEPAAASRAGDLANSPTITSPAMTQMGMILGTAAYMSPEQARGRAVDKRADIWAFGAVLYEMLTGTRAFPGEDITDTLAAVVRAEPDWTLLPRDLSPTLGVFLRRCLQKDPKQRIADIHDVRLALDGAFETTAPTGTPVAVSVAPAAPRARLAWAVASVFGLALAGLAVVHLREAPPPTPTEARVDVITPNSADPFSFALSPDGSQIVYSASGDGPARLWLRPLASTTAKPLAGTEGAYYPFWSPDSRSVGFFADGKLKRLDLGGGAPRTLAPADPGRGGTWNADGVILFAANAASPLLRIPASGGEAVAMTTLDRHRGHRHPFFLPDGRRYVFYAAGTPETAGIHLGSLDDVGATRLVSDEARGIYLPSGWLLWSRADALLAQRLDVERKTLLGNPVTLADQVGVDYTGASAVSVSSAGLIAYRAYRADQRQLAWYDRSGTFRGVVGQKDADAGNAPELSPDGRRVAFDRFTQGNRDVWIMDLIRGGLTRFTFDPAVDGYPVWSPDGSQIAYESRRAGPSFDIWLKGANGAGTDELLLGTPNEEWPYDWSKDGGFLLYQQRGTTTRADLWALPMTGTNRTPIAVAHTPFTERNAQFSPDGRWVAYETDESGRFETVVQPFPEPKSKWQLSTDGGTQPRWNANGREVYFLAPDGTLMSVTFAMSGSAVEAGKAVALFQTRAISQTRGMKDKAGYAVARDGRFLIDQTMEDQSATTITLVQNWRPEAR